MSRLRRGPSIRTLAILAVSGLTLMVVLLGSVQTPAQASAFALIASDPGNHETVMWAPDHVTLTFDQPIRGARVAIAVSGPGGGRVDRGTPAVAGNSAVVRLAHAISSGDYTIGFLVRPGHGRAVSGSIIFELRVPLPHERITDAPSVIASAIATLESPPPTSPPARPGVNQADPGSANRSTPVASTATAAGAGAGAWWHRSSTVTIGALALLVLAGGAVFAPRKRRND